PAPRTEVPWPSRTVRAASSCSRPKDGEYPTFALSAPHLFLGERMRRAGRLRCRTRLQDCLRQRNVGLHRDLDVRRRALDDMYRVAPRLDQLSVIGDIGAELGPVSV